jgi:putative SOS response-associated peptidase YedK
MWGYGYPLPGPFLRGDFLLHQDGPNVDIQTYSFLTTTPNPLVATINHERMPVLLTRQDEFATWLSGSPDDALALAREYAPDQMRIVQEGLAKEGPARDRLRDRS